MYYDWVHSYEDAFHWLKTKTDGYDWLITQRHLCDLRCVNSELPLLWNTYLIPTFYSLRVKNDCRVSSKMLSQNDCRALLLRHLSWLIENHSISTVFPSFVNDFLVMPRSVRLGIVLLDVNRTTLGSDHFDFTSSMSVESGKRLEPYRRSSLSLSYCSLFCAGYRQINLFVIPLRVEMCTFIMMKTFLRSYYSWTWNAARRDSSSW